MNYRIVEKPAFLIAGIQMRTTSINAENLVTIPQFWTKSRQNGLIKQLIDKRTSMGLLGVCYDFRPGDNSFAYLIAIEMPENDLDDLPVGSVQIAIPAATYAVFECKGAMPDAIQNAWHYIYDTWLPSSGFEHGDTLDLEVYPPFLDNREDPTSAEFVSEVWVSIKK